MKHVLLFHRDIGIPDYAKRQLAALPVLQLGYTHHAQRACLDDKNGSVFCPPALYKFKVKNLIEVEVINGTVTKFVVRLEFEPDRDLVLVIQVDAYCPRQGFVRTLWTNLKTDQHNTLDASKYDK